MMAQRPGWELGSDFELVDPSLTMAASSPPWVTTDERVSYFESGRQALAALSRQLRAQGRTRLLMPKYFCESMILPFARDGWIIDFADVTSQFDIEPTPANPIDPAQTVVLSLSYFGADENSNWLAALSDLQSAGAIIISDETHRVLEPGLRSADFRVGSLRKMLPLPDGAFVVGALDSVSREPAKVGELRLAAMKLKSEYLAGHASGLHRTAFAQAEELTELRTAPFHMSKYSYDLIGRLDYGRVRALRKTNTETLLLALKGSSYRNVQTSTDFIRSHVVITGPDVLALRRYLSDNGVFCPVHWPAPPIELDPTKHWPSEFLSIPIDQRYGADDLRRAGQLITQFSAHTSPDKRGYE